MNIIKEAIKHKTAIPILLISLTIILSVSMNSCTRKDKPNVKQDSTVKSEEIPNDDMVQLFYKGQLCHWVRCIFQDIKGDLWFGTNHYGVIRYNGDTLEYFTEKSGFAGSRVNEIIEDKKGNVWFATSEGLTKYDGRSFTNYSMKDGLVNDEVWSVIIDRNYIFWIGTSEGISRFDGAEFTTFPIPKVSVKDTTSMISYNRVSHILEDKNGNLWFGTDGFGIRKYDGKTFTNYTKLNGLCDNNIAEMMEDKEGNIWIGTMHGGVSRYDGKTFTNFTRNGEISGEEVYGFHEEKNGNIWFAAENTGVYRFNGSSFTIFNAKDGLETNGIQAIYEDKEGRFWLGGWKGLFRFDGKNFFPVTKNGPWL